MSSPRRVLVVHNPGSGGGAGALIATDLHRALETRGAQVATLATRPAGEPDVFAEVDPSAHDVIAIVGGDGTFHGAVEQLASLTTPLAFVGAGTINVLARELHLPADAARAAEVILAGRTLTVPLLQAGGRRFLLFAEAGFLARIVAVVNQLRDRVLHRHGKAEFVAAALGIVPLAWGRPLRIEAELPDGTLLHRRYANALVSRVRCYGGSMTLPVEAGVDVPLGEATFELFGLASGNPLGHVVVLVLANLGALPRMQSRLSRWGLLERHRVRRVRIEGPRRERVHADGETRFEDGSRIQLPMEVAACGAALRLLVP